MRLSHWKSLLALLFAFSLVAAACSGDDTETSSTDNTNATDESTDSTEAMDDTATTEAAGDSSGGNSVTITGTERSDEEAGSLQAVLGAFGEANGFTVNYVPSADWEAEINVAIEGGTEPDISIFPQPGKLADFARDGHLLALPDDVNSSVSANWDESWMSFGNVDGTQFGVPNKSDLKSLVWYQPGRFEELGYTVPTTWDELVTLTETAAADGNTPWCVGLESGQATGWPFTDWTEDLMLRTAGPEAYDQWVAGELKFSDPAVIDVFNMIKGLWDIEDAVFSAGGSIVATAFQDNGQPLVDGDCLMHRQASFFSAFIPEGTAFADGSDGAVDTFYFPTVDGTKPVLVAGTVAAAFHDTPEVWMVMEYLGSAEYANARQAAQKELKGGAGVFSGFLSAVKGQDLSGYEPLEQGFIEIIETAEVARFDGSDLMPADVGAGTFWTEGTNFVNGDATAEEAAAKIDASWPAG